MHEPSPSITNLEDLPVQPEIPLDQDHLFVRQSHTKSSSQEFEGEQSGSQPKEDKIILPKVLYFTYYGASAFVNPFLPAYFRQIGLSASQSGFVLSVSPFVSLISTPIFGLLADRFRNQYKVIFLFGLLVAASLKAGLFFCRSFLSVFLWLIPTEFFYSPISSLIDNFTIQLLAKHGGDAAKMTFGKQRLWGAVGWGVFGSVAGYLLSHVLPANSTASYGFLFAIFFLGALITLLEIWLFFPARLDHPEKQAIGESGGEDEAEGSDSARFQFSQLLEFVTFPNLIFYLSLLTMGASNALHYNVMILYLLKIGGSEFLWGIDTFVMCVGEVITFYIADWIIKKFSVAGTLCVAMSCCIVRLLAYCIIPSPYWALPLDFLYGCVFSAFWSASIYHSDLIAPEGLSATSQGISNGAYWGIGYGGGSIIGGVLYQSIGGPATFQLSAASIFFSLICFLGEHFLKKRKYGRVTAKIEGGVELN